MGEAKRRKLAGDFPHQATAKQPQKRQTETVEWEVVDDLAKHPRSQDVLQLLSGLKKTFVGMGGNQMVTVLEDQVQQPVIRIQTLGLGAFMSLVGELQELGLVDRLESSTQPERGIDAAFS